MNKIPTTKEMPLSQSERFLIGFKDLANECGLAGVKYQSTEGISNFVFDDDSCLHFRTLLVELGCRLPDAINNGWPNFK